MAERQRRAPPRGGTPRRRRRRFTALRGLVVAALVAVAFLGLYLYVDVTMKFEGRLWTAPTRIYSDVILLRPGLPIGIDSVADWLRRSGYTAGPEAPTRPGEYRVAGGALDVYLRAFRTGAETRPARRLRIAFRGDRIVALRDQDGGRLGRAELEPELLSVAFGAHQEERQVVRLAEVPQGLIHAILAAEDSRFYAHPGFDPLAIVRAAFANLRGGRIVQGGSTITQQTVKNIYLGQERTWWRKMREVVLAVVLDLRYTKDRILEAYLNEVYLGQRGPVSICGVQAAARHYFGRDLSDLSTAEWATLAGLIRNPGGYNPFAHPERAIERRDHVLASMVEQGRLTAEEAAAARGEPLRLAVGTGSFFRDPYAIDFVRSQLSEAVGSEGVAGDGVEVYTSIDPIVQQGAEEALRRGIERLERDMAPIRRQRSQRDLQGSIVVLDPRTGAILAIVGGRDYRESQFNRAVQARRQPGSCFKPFVYLAGLEAARLGQPGGLTAATMLEDAPLELVSGGRLWSPENYDREFRGSVTARAALEQSLNVPTVRAAQAVGLQNVVEVTRGCGIASRLEPLPALALGAQEVTPLELAAAYGTVANGGARVGLRVIRAIVEPDGGVAPGDEPEAVRAVSPQAAFVLTDMLRGVLSRGTAASASQLGFAGEAAGKTGTTDDTRDAWFVGFTPDIVVMVWVGYDDNARTGLTGASGALPIWVDVMRAARHRWGGSSFHEPDGVVRIEVDPESGERATPACPSRVEELFIEGTEPEEPCSLHAGGFLRWLKRLFGRDS